VHRAACRVAARDAAFDTPPVSTMPTSMTGNDSTKRRPIGSRSTSIASNGTMST